MVDSLFRLARAVAPYLPSLVPLAQTAIGALLVAVLRNNAALAQVAVFVADALAALAPLVAAAEASGSPAAKEAAALYRAARAWLLEQGFHGEAARFLDTDLPDLYQEAARLLQTQGGAK